MSIDQLINCIKKIAEESDYLKLQIGDTVVYQEKGKSIKDNTTHVEIIIASGTNQESNSDDAELKSKEIYYSFNKELICELVEYLHSHLQSIPEISSKIEIQKAKPRELKSSHKYTLNVFYK